MRLFLTWGSLLSLISALPLGAAHAATVPVVTAIATNNAHSCAVVGGSLQCWGANQDGQIGLGLTMGSVDAPSPILASGVTSVATGMLHTCAVVNGGVQCWGNNNYNQVGNAGEGGNEVDPVSIIAGGALQVSGTGHRTCAVVNAGLQCWGYAYPDTSDGIINTDLPSPTVEIENGVSSVAVGDGHSCVIRSNSSLQCWGSNFAGRVGTGSDPGNVPVPATIIASGVSAVATGVYHTCAVVSGALKCWGSNWGIYGSDGLTLSPTTVINSGVTAVTAGYLHTCAIVNGALKCWGWNSSGQVGVGHFQTYVNTPTTVLSSGVTAVSAGWNQTCAVVNGSAQCWGEIAARTANGQYQSHVFKPVVLIDPSDSDNDGIPNTVEASLGLNPLRKDNNVLANTSASRRLFVMQMFRDVLFREGSSTAVDYWTGQLNAGMTRSQMVQAFMNSNPGNSQIKPLARLFIALFGNLYPAAASVPVDGQSINGFTANARSLATGQTDLTTLSTALVNSAAFNRQFGVLSDAQFATLVFNHVLGTAPTADQVNTAVASIQSSSRGAWLKIKAERPSFVSLSAAQISEEWLAIALARQPSSSASAWRQKFQVNPSAAADTMINAYLGSYLPDYSEEARLLHNRFLPWQ